MMVTVARSVLEQLVQTMFDCSNLPIGALNRFLRPLRSEARRLGGFLRVRRCRFGVRSRMFRPFRRCLCLCGIIRRGTSGDAHHCQANRQRGCGCQVRYGAHQRDAASLGH